MKEFEVLDEKSQVKVTMDEREIAKLLLPSAFQTMLMRMNINESMFHHLTMKSFKRVK